MPCIMDSRLISDICQTTNKHLANQPSDIMGCEIINIVQQRERK